MSGVIQQFPQKGTSFQDADGKINSVWYMTLRAMWTRTGGGTSDASITGLQTQINTLQTEITSIQTQVNTLNTAKVAKSGDTMTGQLILAGVPGSPLGAVPKSYVDTSVSTEATARIAADALLLPLAGGTMTGPTAQFRTAATTVAGLPTGVAGMSGFVTDALGPVFNVAVVGGGAVSVPVFYDGATWKVG